MNWATATEYVFWLSVSAVTFTYLGYPLLIFLLAALKQTWRDAAFLAVRQNRRQARGEEFIPSVALLVAAYNEESVIEAKLQNTAALDYPRGQFECLLGLDASTDATEGRAARLSLPWLRLFPFETRRGKLAVINDLAERTTAEILIFSDANTMLEPDCVRRLVRHFADPKVGAVCGELRYRNPDGRVQMGSFYWRFEVMLKFLENRLGCTLGANGAVYAVRCSLFRPLRDSIIEDFQLPMEILFEGNRVLYDPEAVAEEPVAPSFGTEFHRKSRIGAGGYQTLVRNPQFLNPLKGMPAFAYFSHKVLRWMAPLALLAALGASTVLVETPLYQALLAAQVAFYLLVVWGYWRQQRGQRLGLLALPLFFVTLHLALLAGMVRYFSGRQTAVWKATPRTAPATALPAKGSPHE